ncbi:hypothetical protein V2A60_007593 [Cordyceps javanica]|uniref:BZIP domain-containing protein n=1 Tax=Cordyceps javanica TaxID=43265 RepID=A0A545W7D0_9HYPO|nr:hypothetical protein IF1G_02779 [Cordyceps javanica]TQW09910.1 hypothetical protein IF2G_02700 [Cordyceps javanica]
MADNGAQERKLRKRLQNRVNQRQRRSRKREEAQPSARNQRPYQVDRWRYVYQHDARKPDTRSDISPEPASTQGYVVPGSNLSYRGQKVAQWSPVPQVATSQLRQFKPSPTQDHLLHLIQINVLRGLFDNKLAILSCAHYLTRSATAELEVTAPELVFPGRAAIIPSSGCLPNSLSPTPLQSTTVHATCIDLVPFAGIRDSMITWEGCFDFAELVQDLVGNLVDPTCFFTGLPCPKKHMAQNDAVRYHGEEDHDYAANRNGLILWGEAHLLESWEVTSGFLRKWGWLVEGCQGLIESSNRWRVARGEEPLQAAWTTISAASR